MDCKRVARAGRVAMFRERLLWRANSHDAWHALAEQEMCNKAAGDCQGSMHLDVHDRARASSVGRAPRACV